MIRVVQVALPALLFSLSTVSSASDEIHAVSDEVSTKVNEDVSNDIEKITVESSTTANTKPVGTFGSPVSNLEYDPRVDLQSRNMAEAQADVTIRGGIFENTGFRAVSYTHLTLPTIYSV